MPFINYNSIPNHTNKRKIDEYINLGPNFLNSVFICQHKYDGSNFQIIFKKLDNNQIEIRYASRSCVLDKNQNFNDCIEVLKKQVYESAMKNIQNYLIYSEQIKSINLFGEIYGKVQNRIKYNENKENEIIFFDVVFDDKYKTQKFFIEWANSVGLPVVECFKTGTFQECVEIDLNEFKTKTGDRIEGVVIKPFDISVEGLEPFYIKLKSPGFEEVVPKKIQNNKDQSNKKLKFKDLFDEHQDLESFENYLNINRVKSALSKKNWTKKELQVLANFILEDAFKDFKIDFETTKLDLNVLKKVYFSDIFKIINEEKIF